MDVSAHVGFPVIVTGIIAFDERTLSLEMAVTGIVSDP
jgi:hypothetical protein